MTETLTRTSNYIYDYDTIDIYTCPEEHIASVDLTITAHNPGNGWYDIYLLEENDYFWMNYLASWQQINSGHKHKHKGIILGPGQTLKVSIMTEEYEQGISLQATIITQDIN